MKPHQVMWRGDNPGKLEEIKRIIQGGGGRVIKETTKDGIVTLEGSIGSRYDNPRFKERREQLERGIKQPRDEEAS